MRLFIALPLPDAERQRLAEIASALTYPGRPTPPERYHVTLRFLGDVGSEEAARQIVHAVQPEPIPVVFGPLVVLGRQRVVAVSVQADPPLTTLYTTLDRLSQEQGFPPADYAVFRPHVTLLRSRRAIPSSVLPSEPVGGGFVAERIVLYRSEHIGGQLVYTPLAERTLV